MRKLYLILFVYLTLLCNALDKNSEHYIETDLTQFAGTYLPINYLKVLDETLSHKKALEATTGHHCLIVNPNIIYSNLGYHDQYAIKAKDFKGFKIKENSEKLIVADNKGNEYIRISENYKNGYDEIRFYIEDFIAKNVTVISKSPSGKLLIDNNEYSIVLDLIFIASDSNLILRGENGLLSIKITDTGYQFFDFIGGEGIMSFESDTVKFAMDK